MFLTEIEIDELTGIATGRRGRKKFELQVEFLRANGLPFIVNARGRPIIARAYFESAQLTPPPKKAWQPNLGA